MNIAVPSAGHPAAQKPLFKLLIISLVLACLSIGAGCDSSKENSSKETDAPAANESADVQQDQRAQDADAPKTAELGPDTVLAEAGPVRVTMQDFEHSLRLSRLVAPEGQLQPAVERLASPRLHARVVQSLLKAKIIRHVAAERDITASAEEKIAALKSRRNLARYAPILKASAGESDDADAESTADEGRAEDAAEKAAAELKKRRLEPADLEFAAERLALEKKLRAALVDAINEEDLWRDYTWRADRAKVLQVHASNIPTMGEVRNFVAAHPEQIEEYFARNKNRWASGSEPVELTDSLRRRIASTLLARDSVVPSVRKKLRRAIEEMEKLQDAGFSNLSEAKRKQAVDELIEAFESRGLSASRTPLFSHNARGFIPEFGLAEELAREIFAAELSDPVSPEPILSRGKVWAFMLLEREHPSREEFEANKKSLRKEYVARAKGSIVDRFVGSFQRKHGARLNLEPLRIKYGATKPGDSDASP
jgi:hypothetical protein